MRAVHACAQDTPLLFQRDVWTVEYVADDARSHYTVDFGSVVPDALANTTSDGKSIYLWNLLHLYLYRGSPPYSPTLYTHALYGLLAAQTVVGEFQALLFLHPRQWGLVADSLEVNMAVVPSAQIEPRPEPVACRAAL